MANRWSFKVELEYCNKEDIKIFYQAVIESRKGYLVANKIDIKMIFYTWYDSMSGNFYFSLIPTNWSKLTPGKELPFGCTINKVNSLDKIIEEFVNCPYKGVIPFDGFEDVDPSEDNNDDDEKFMKNYVLNVWSCLV